MPEENLVEREIEQFGQTWEQRCADADPSDLVMCKGLLRNPYGIGERLLSQAALLAGLCDARAHLLEEHFVLDGHGGAADRCKAKATGPANTGVPANYVSFDSILATSALKFDQHSVDVNPYTKSLQSVFGGEIVNSAKLALTTAYLITEYSSVPASNDKVRVTGDVGFNVGTDRATGQDTQFLSAILSKPLGTTDDGLTKRNLVSVFPGC